LESIAAFESFIVRLIKAAHESNHTIRCKINSKDKAYAKQPKTGVVGNVIDKGKEPVSGHAGQDALNFCAQITVKILSFRQVLNKGPLEYGDERKKCDHRRENRQEEVVGNGVRPGKEVIPFQLVLNKNKHIVQRHFEKARQGIVLCPFNDLFDNGQVEQLLL
jgi:hypothetical protein